MLLGAVLAAVLPLTAPDGKAVQFETAGQVTAVFFISTICPIGNDYNDRFSALYRDYRGRGVQLLFVNSHVNEPAEMARLTLGFVNRMLSKVDVCDSIASCPPGPPRSRIWSGPAVPVNTRFAVSELSTMGSSPA